MRLGWTLFHVRRLATVGQVFDSSWQHVSNTISLMPDLVFSAAELCFFTLCPASCQLSEKRSLRNSALSEFALCEVVCWWPTQSPKLQRTICYHVQSLQLCLQKDIGLRRRGSRLTALCSLGRICSGGCVTQTVLELKWSFHGVHPISIETPRPISPCHVEFG